MLSELWSDIRYRFRAVFNRGRLDDELDDELRFHLEREADKLVGAGHSPEEAQRLAAVAFGRTGREGRFLGSLFAVLALAVAVRIALAGSGAAQSYAFSVLQPWLAETLWLCAALLLLAGRLR